jgi:hypothetical protein
MSDLHISNSALKILLLLLYEALSYCDLHISNSALKILLLLVYEALSY